MRRDDAAELVDVRVEPVGDQELLDEPAARKKSPDAANAEVRRRRGRRSWSAMSVKRTIGPAIRCGNSATNVVYSRMCRVGSHTPSVDVDRVRHGVERVEARCRSEGARGARAAAPPPDQRTDAVQRRQEERRVLEVSRGRRDSP